MSESARRDSPPKKPSPLIVLHIRRHLRTLGSRIVPGFLAVYHGEDGQVVRALWYIVVAVGDGKVGITGWAA